MPSLLTFELSHIFGWTFVSAMAAFSTPTTGLMLWWVATQALVWVFVLWLTTCCLSDLQQWVYAELTVGNGRLLVA